MRGTVILPFLSVIATILVTSSAHPGGHPFTPREMSPSTGQWRSDQQEECEYNCELPGKWPFCGKEGCQYTGLRQQNCLVKNCGWKIEKDYMGYCTKPAPSATKCPILKKPKRKHPGRPKKPPQHYPPPKDLNI